LVAAVLLLPATARAQVPQECVECDWAWDLYLHETQVFLLEQCTEEVQLARQAAVPRLNLDLTGLLQPRYSGLPFTRFDGIDVFSADCSAITRPARQWLWDTYLSACVQGLPASCRSAMPRP
jgi:hypothetical protein